MYIPKKNLQTDQKLIIEFIRRFSFGTIITIKDNMPIASHLPFIIVQNDNETILKSHFAKANEQWKDIEKKNILIIFNEPHAYISPKNYDKELNVPTWNYISVHAYGQGKIISETEQVFELLERTIETFEQDYKHQWNRLPQDYRLKMANGIVAFEIVITELQAKEKLSQNKKESEQKKIINSLSNSKNTNEILIADYMKKRT